MFHGYSFNRIDKKRGRSLVEAAAAGGCPSAVAYCKYHGWGEQAVDRHTAFAMFKNIAEETGFDEERVLVGTCFLWGEGVERSYKDAFKWLTLAAENGHGGAMNEIGWLYELRHHMNDLMERWWTAAAETGHVGAMFNIACARDEEWTDLDFNSGQDLGKAVELYTKAAGYGHGPAMYQLARCYQHGRVVEQSETLALQWCRKSRDVGYVEAWEMYPEMVDIFKK